MSVRSGPLTPGPSVSASSLAAAAAAAYDSLGLVSGPNSGSTYNTSRHSPSSPSQTSSAGGLYSFNSNSSVPFGLPNSSNGTGTFSSFDFHKNEIRFEILFFFKENIFPNIFSISFAFPISF